MVGQQPAELGGLQDMFVTFLAHQGDESLVCLKVKPTVTNEMKDVPGALPHHALQITPRLPLKPNQIQQASAPQVFDGFSNSFPFTVYV